MNSTQDKPSADVPKSHKRGRRPKPEADRKGKNGFVTYVSDNNLSTLRMSKTDFAGWLRAVTEEKLKQAKETSND